MKDDLIERLKKHYGIGHPLINEAITELQEMQQRIAELECELEARKENKASQYLKRIDELDRALELSAEKFIQLQNDRAYGKELKRLDAALAEIEGQLNLMGRFQILLEEMPEAARRLAEKSRKARVGE